MKIVRHGTEYGNASVLLNTVLLAETLGDTESREPTQKNSSITCTNPSIPYTHQCQPQHTLHTPVPTTAYLTHTGTNPSIPYTHQRQPQHTLQTPAPTPAHLTHTSTNPSIPYPDQHQPSTPYTHQCQPQHALHTPAPTTAHLTHTSANPSTLYTHQCQPQHTLHTPVHFTGNLHKNTKQYYHFYYRWEKLQNDNKILDYQNGFLFLCLHCWFWKCICQYTLH